MDNYRVIEFSGEIDIFAKRWVELELERVEGFDDGAFAILDLTSIRYLDSTFLNALTRVRVNLAAQKPNTRICLVAPRKGVGRRIFELTKLAMPFPLFEDLPSACRSGFTLVEGSAINDEGADQPRGVAAVLPNDLRGTSIGDGSGFANAFRRF